MALPLRTNSPNLKGNRKLPGSCLTISRGFLKENGLCGGLGRDLLSPALHLFGGARTEQNSEKSKQTMAK